MIRGTYGEAVVYGVEDRSVLLPYFGGTEEENWYLTYPAFQIAASAKGTEDPARRALILDIMTAMLDQEVWKISKTERTSSPTTAGSS